jgi:hypothetical protein
MTTDEFVEMALSFPGVIPAPHFDRTAFKVKKKRIFATLHSDTQIANLKFSPADQSVFALINKQVIYPVNNKWGLQGWTTFELPNIGRHIMLDALDTAFKEASKLNQ